jgi:hypothetical protein
MAPRNESRNQGVFNMLKKIVLAALAACLVILLAPAPGNAYGAAYRGRTYVGGYGAYHSSRYAYSGAGGGYAYGGRSTAFGYGGATTRYGGVYHSGSVGYGQYPNTTSYYGGSRSYGYGYGSYR